MNRVNIFGLNNYSTNADGKSTILISVIHLPKFSSFPSPFHSHTVSFIITKMCFDCQIFNFVLPSNLNHLICCLCPTGLILSPFPQAWYAYHKLINLPSQPHYSSMIISTVLFSAPKQNIAEERHQVIQACTCSQSQNSFRVQATIHRDSHS